MTVHAYGMDIKISFIRSKNEIKVAEYNENNLGYLSTLFFDVNNNIGLLNTSDPLSIKVALRLEREGVIEKTIKQNPYSLFPSYIIKM